MAHSHKHVGSFSPNEKFFASINSQGILRIWDVEKNTIKQEISSDLHMYCTAFIWIHINQTSNKEKNNENDSLYLALATNDGKISLFSYALGKIERKLAGYGHSGKITYLCENRQGLLFTCGDDCQIIIWSIPAEKQIHSISIGSEKPYCISYLAKSQSLAIGTRQIKVISLDTEENLQTFSGHTTNIDHMTSFTTNDNEEYLLSSSRMERIICLWKIGERGRNKAPIANFLMEDIAICLSCSFHLTDLKLVCVTRSGVSHVYTTKLEEIKSEKPIKPKVTVKIVSDNVSVIEPIPIIVAANSLNNILYGYGKRNLLVFESIEPSYVENTQVLIRVNPTKSLSTEIEDNLDTAFDSNKVNYRSSATSMKHKVKIPDMPMESRLQNLHLNEDDNTAGFQANSKVQLLIQALHSKDATLLRSVLLNNDIKTITMTVQRLPIKYVGTLVNELTFLMQKRYQSVESATIWLQTIIQTHCSQLMAFGANDLQNKFGPCIGIVEFRSNCLKDLSKLSGRLQLLLSQIQRNINVGSLNMENVVTYEDDDDSSDLGDGVDKNFIDDDDNWNNDDDVGDSENEYPTNDDNDDNMET